MLHPDVSLPMMPDLGCLGAGGWSRCFYPIYLAFQSRKDGFDKPEWIPDCRQVQRFAGEVRGWRALCEPPKSSSPPYHHPSPTSLCKFKISCFQPKMNHSAPARAASIAEGAACVSCGTGSSMSSKTSLNFIPVVGKGWIQVWSHWQLLYEFHSSKNQP